MATWLAYLKSKLLLPEDENDDLDDIIIPDDELNPFKCSSCECALCKCINNIKIYILLIKMKHHLNIILIVINILMNT